MIGIRILSRITSILLVLSICMSANSGFADRNNKAYEIGIASSMTKVRFDVPFTGKLSDTIKISLAGNEYEGVQLIVTNVEKPIRDMFLKIGELKSGNGSVLEASNVTWSTVGYVKTKLPSKYRVSYTGWWPDPLLDCETFNVSPHETQPIWLTVYAPPRTQPGHYRGTITLLAENILPRTVKLDVQVWGFDLPVHGHLKTMAVDVRIPGEFYGLANEEKHTDKLKVNIYEALLKHRLGPGGSALLGFSWKEPLWGRQGRYDFSEADKWGEFCFRRGMNAFVIARFPEPGKWGFPEHYSETWKNCFSDFVKAYTKHLQSKGWNKYAYIYNIDEAPPRLWETCKANYRLSKAFAPDIRVMQCLNNPEGVNALAGFADTWDMTLLHYNKSGLFHRKAQGEEVWWNVCCWPSGHPNLFVDYPAIDARIIGWLSWKLNIDGFEYWQVTSWRGNTKKNNEFADIRSNWKTNVFRDYNGDGYLLYPGKDLTVLPSIRLENLRDGFEDYEYLAILKQMAAKAKKAKGTGATVDRAFELLSINDEICKKDLTFTSSPERITQTRARIAGTIEKLKDIYAVKHDT